MVIDTKRASPARQEQSLEVLSAIADPIRWTVLEQLSDQCQCVCDLQENVAVAPNLLSYHLKVLREAGLVTATRRGRWMDYALAPDAHEKMIAALPGPIPSATTPPRPGCPPGDHTDADDGTER